MKTREVIEARGHPNILATHETTLEITKETELTKRGDCIIALGATKAAADLSSEFKEAAKQEDAEITMLIEADDERDFVKARGDPQLSFEHTIDMVIRISSYVCDRTIAVKADKAAVDLSRKLTGKLRDPSQRIKITLTVESY
jgi:hypothetical protein